MADGVSPERRARTLVERLAAGDAEGVEEVAAPVAGDLVGRILVEREGGPDLLDTVELSGG